MHPADLASHARAHESGRELRGCGILDPRGTAERGGEGGGGEGRIARRGARGLRGEEGTHTYRWLELRRLPPIMGFVGSGPGLVTLLA